MVMNINLLYNYIYHYMISVLKPVRKMDRSFALSILRNQSSQTPA